jgi:hypothetical protein
VHIPARLLQDELNEKRSRVSRFLNDYRLDGVWLALPENFAWYTAGGNSNPNTGLLVLKDVTYLIAPTADGERILQEESTAIASNYAPTIGTAPKPKLIY